MEKLTSSVYAALQANLLNKQMKPKSLEKPRLAFLVDRAAAGEKANAWAEMLQTAEQGKQALMGRMDKWELEELLAAQELMQATYVLLLHLSTLPQRLMLQQSAGMEAKAAEVVVVKTVVTVELEVKEVKAEREGNAIARDVVA